MLCSSVIFLLAVVCQDCAKSSDWAENYFTADLSFESYFSAQSNVLSRFWRQCSHFLEVAPRGVLMPLGCVRGCNPCACRIPNSRLSACVRNLSPSFFFVLCHMSFLALGTSAQNQSIEQEIFHRRFVVRICVSTLRPIEWFFAFLAVVVKRVLSRGKNNSISSGRRLCALAHCIVEKSLSRICQCNGPMLFRAFVINAFLQQTNAFSGIRG